MRAATQVSADEEAIPIVGRVSVMQFVALDRRCAGAAAQFTDNFGHYADIGTMNGKFPKGKLPFVVAAAVATAALERRGRTGTIGHDRPVAIFLQSRR